MDFLLDQLAQAGPISSRRMFGEYCLYFDGRPVGLVCDDQLYLKPTEPGRALQRLKDAVEGYPYPGARPHLLITADHWDDRNWLAQMVRTTAHALPPPKQPKPRAAVQAAAGALKAKPASGRAANAGAPERKATLAPNLGPKSMEMLASVGITTLAELRKLGAVAAYARVRARHARASLNLLWALEGALSGLPWQEVAREHRTSLLLALEHEQARKAHP